MVEHGNVTIERNRLVGSFPQWGPIFRVTFDLKIESETKLPNCWMQVLRVTDMETDNDAQVPGNRVPGVWLCFPEEANSLCGENSTCLLIGSYISSKYDEAVYLTISRDRFISIEIAQWEMDGFYFYHVYIDGKLYVRMQNHTPANFTNVNVFTSDNVYCSFGEIGQMRNLEVATWLQQPADCYISK